ncbi:MAG: DNA methyltransferase [Terriglobia bacterium]
MAVVGPEPTIEPERVNLRGMFPGIGRGRNITHGFDNYPAKMIPHMARFLLERVSCPGETILDPFCGSGAVLVESLVNNRKAVGVDFNPYAVLLARAKTTPYDGDLLEAQLREILKTFSTWRSPFEFQFANASYWFTPATLWKLGVVRSALERCTHRMDWADASFWVAVAASTVRACSRADTRGPKPFISKKARLERSGRHFDPFKLFEQKARAWIALQRDYVATLARTKGSLSVKVLHGDSRELSRLLRNQRIDAIVTSPPYLNAQDYYRSSKLELLCLGIATTSTLREWSRRVIGSDRILLDPDLLEAQLPCLSAEEVRRALAKRNRKNACVFAKYVLDMHQVFSEIRKILNAGAYCAIVSSYNLISGIVIPTSRIIADLASNEGFRLDSIFKDKIRDRWVPTRRNGHDGVIREEHLLVLRRR